ncbi:nucleotide exchange factor GrpE, partial [Escherichia coli]|uniref:nucleotide exchange factor GrpE n=1 Tax=Escherichia coli TaxID=562 RepID=UPI0032E7F925
MLDDGVVVNGQVNQHGGRLRGFCLVIYTVFFPAGNCRSPLEPRAEQDVEKAHKFALEKFAGDLLAVVDTLERGLEMSDPNDEAIKPMREGME